MHADFLHSSFFSFLLACLLHVDLLRHRWFSCVLLFCSRRCRLLPVCLSALRLQIALIMVVNFECDNVNIGCIFFIFFSVHFLTSICFNIVVCFRCTDGFGRVMNRVQNAVTVLGVDRRGVTLKIQSYLLLKFLPDVYLNNKI